MQANAEAVCTPDTFASREVQRNTIVHTITLTECERDQQICTDELLPCLERNRYRPRALAIKKADIQILRLLLGVALQTESVHTATVTLL
jgi:predicted nucleic acid-binding Zn ribbon protein